MKGAFALLYLHRIQGTMDVLQDFVVEINHFYRAIVTSLLWLDDLMFVILAGTLVNPDRFLQINHIYRHSIQPKYI